MNHNVYILGAGFSAQAGFPLIGNFQEKMLETKEWLRDKNRTRELTAIEKVLDFRRSAGGACEHINFNPSNIEDLFSLASAIDSAQMEDVSEAIAATLNYAKKQFLLGALKYRMRVVPWPTNTGGEIPERKEGLTLYGHFADMLAGKWTNKSSQNTIITFNYDTLLEEGFKEADSKYEYGFVEPLSSTTSLFKLHGSVNWTTKGIYEDYEDIFNRDETPLLIPPTWNKIINDEKLQNAWRGAGNSLKTARRIIVIGFSFPLSDSQFKYLLAAGLTGNYHLKEIWIVDPNSEVVKTNVESIFSDRTVGLVRYYPGTAHSFLTNCETIMGIERTDYRYNLNLGNELSPDIASTVKLIHP